jgi:hypothetical protein
MQLEEEYLERGFPPSSGATASSAASGRTPGLPVRDEPSSGARRRFFVGQWVDVKDTVAQWLEATVMEINEAERLMFVHYNGW